MKNFLYNNWFKMGILFILLGLTPITTYATSGACSYHGGVNYSAGYDYDGSVICNDGWRDSSVTATFTCPYPTSHKVDCGSVTAMNARHGLLGSSFGEANMAQCEAQNSQVDQAQAAYQLCLQSQSNIETHTLRVQQEINDKLEKDREMYRQLEAKEKADQEAVLKKILESRPEPKPAQITPVPTQVIFTPPPIPEPQVVIPPQDKTKPKTVAPKQNITKRVASPLPAVQQTAATTTQSIATTSLPVEVVEVKLSVISRIRNFIKNLFK